VALAIGRLPERQRAAVVFVHQEGLSNIETAELMGISVEAVESLLARGRRSLRKMLEALRPDSANWRMHAVHHGLTLALAAAKWEFHDSP